MKGRGVEYTKNQALSITTEDNFDTETIAGLDHAIVVVEGATIRFFVNGQTATASLGAILNPGDVLELDSRHQLVNFSACSKDGGTATLRCQFGG